MDKIKIFEGQDVTVKTDEGKTLINLVHVAKCCGVVIKDNSRGTIRVNWNARNGIRDKLKSLCEAFASQEIGEKCVGEDSSKKYSEEIEYILDEIESADDRNAIYTSSWLAKRLAVECHSDTAMRFKNFLVTMDEKREEKIEFNKDTALEQFAAASEQMAIIGQAVQGLQKMTLGIQEYVKESIQSKDKQIDEIKELVGMRTVNTKKLTKASKKCYQ